MIIGAVFQAMSIPKILCQDICWICGQM